MRTPEEWANEASAVEAAQGTNEHFEALAREAKLREVVEEILVWFPNCAQLLDGWHGDGTCWTECDTQVRNELSRLQQQALAATKEPDHE